MTMPEKASRVLYERGAKARKGEEVMDESVFPAHKVSLHLTHNDYLGVYETVADRIAVRDFGYDPDDWVSEEQMNKAVETNTMWTLQWYPETPVGFCMLSACDLDVLLAYAREHQ